MLMVHGMSTFMYGALTISHSHFYPNNSQKTAIAHPLWQGMAGCRELKIWSEFYLRSCYTVCNIMVCDTAIY